MFSKNLGALSVLSLVAGALAPVVTINGDGAIPQRGRNTHRPYSGSQPVAGGGVRERARNIARAEKAAQKAASLNAA